MTAEELYNKYEQIALKRAGRFCISMKACMPEIQEEDVQQEARLVLWELCLNRSEDDSFVKYLNDSIKNHFIDLRRKAKGINKVYGERKFIEIDEYWAMSNPDQYEHSLNKLDYPSEWELILNDKDEMPKLCAEVNSFELIRKAKELSGSDKPAAIRKHVVKWLSLIMFAAKVKHLGHKQKLEIEEALKALKLDSDENIHWNMREMKLNRLARKTKIELYS